MPVCNVCNINKSVDKFHKNGLDKDGNEARRKDCIECYTITRKTNSAKGKKNFKKFKNSMLHRTGEVITASHEDWRDMMLWFGGSCAYCGQKQSRKMRLTVDHVIPVVKGGTTCRNNMVPACRKCNSSKGSSDLLVWYRKCKFYDIRKHAKILLWGKK